MRRQKERIIHPPIDELNEARKWRCMVWSRLHGYFKDSLTLSYKIQSTKIAIICITAFLVWLSCFLISHQWDWAWSTSNRSDIFDSFALLGRIILSLSTRLTPIFKRQNTFVTGNDIAHSLRPWVFWQNRVLEFKVLFFSWEIFYCLVTKLGKKNSRILLFLKLLIFY